MTDQGFSRDVASWAKMTGNRLVDVKEEKGYNYGCVGERGRSLSRGEGRSGEQQDADRVQR